MILDATARESLVYSVDGDQRTLAGAMYIASQRPADDPSLTDFAGPLMTWHKHDNLCWDTGDDGKAKVVGLIDAEGNCARGTRAGGANPMVHVWITPHPCGVFAALAGVGAGTAAVPEDQRVDTCSDDHAGHDGETDDHAEHEVETRAAAPYDPTMPIDLSGFPGVTPSSRPPRRISLPSRSCGSRSGATTASPKRPGSAASATAAGRVHVWITPRRCGPFAALEGVGAGQILEGEERLCDHIHGA